MKKRISFLLALLLTLSALSAIPMTASADPLPHDGRTYALYKSDTAPIPDGVAESTWDAYEWSENFAWRYTNGSYRNDDLKANFKALWVEDATDPTKINLNILVQYKGYVNYPTLSGVRLFFFNENGVWSSTDIIRIDGNKAGFDITYTHYKEGTYSAAIRVQDDTVTFEFCGRFTKADNLKLDVCVVDGNAWSNYADYSWNGCTANGSEQKPTGGLKIMQKPGEVDQNDAALFVIDNEVVASAAKDANGNVTLPSYELTGANLIGWVDPSGKLYPVGGTYPITGSTRVQFTGFALAKEDYSLLDGASILIEEPTAMRFEVWEDANTDAMKAIADKVTEKGLLLVETAKLTEAITADGAITAAELDAANIPYEKITFETARDKIHYAEKNNITDLSLSYSASAYITVQFADGVARPVYLTYSALVNARCVKDVAKAAYEDRSTVPAEVADGLDYKFKLGKDFAFGDYILSFSPYTKEQLTLLTKLGQ